MKDRNLPDRPLRTELESFLDGVPAGPLGVFGDGNVFGGAVYLTTSAIQGVTPIDGLEVGYNVESSSITRQDGQEMHTYRINAASKQVAEFAARYKSSPSNIDYIADKPEVTGTTLVKERRSLPLWEVTVLVGDGRGEREATEAQSDVNSNMIT